MEADNLSPFFKWVNTLPKIFKTIIYWIIWISPFEMFTFLAYNATSNVDIVDLNKNGSLPKLAAYLNESPLNQLEKSSDLSSLLLERTKELEVIGVPIYLLSILALVSLLSWYFKGAPRNKNRLVNTLLNPLLSVIPLSLIQILSVFGSNTVKQIHLLLNSDLQMNSFLTNKLCIYKYLFISLLRYLSLFVCVVLIVGNKKARNLI